MIISIIGSILFSIVLVLYILMALRLPYGEYAMGGKYKVLPKKERIISLLSVIIQTFAILILLQCGGLISFGVSDKIANVFCYFFAVYLSLNILMNLLSKSKKEFFYMTPLSFVIAICYWLTALNVEF
ncbi:hypothetical protein CLV91_1777 [Maribacter vaceletii]|uniref:DUF4181 domain-containing protein n=1 Tax=Maribacter vaceletii TaxID=1206816 RepID=A0A495E989_9FLAO|nr:hypothetical protein CLV91_1777 [Maribacter vaceletii]